MAHRTSSVQVVSDPEEDQLVLEDTLALTSATDVTKGRTKELGIQEDTRLAVDLGKAQFEFHSAVHSAHTFLRLQSFGLPLLAFYIC